MSLTRRDFLRQAGGAVAGLAALRATPALADAPSRRGRGLPAPNSSGIEHIVVLCMENRSFDHFLGWVPHANGRQAGLSYPDNDGHLHPTHHLTEWQGCGFNDPDHSYSGGRIQLDGGKCDGFRRGDNDDYAIGYYTEGDVPTNSALVRNFTVCDQWFASILGPTYPNRFYTHAAQTDRITNSMTQSTVPRSGTAWKPPASRRTTTSATCRSSPSGPTSTSTWAVRSTPSMHRRRRARCRSTATWIRSSWARTRAARTTTTPTPTSGGASRSSATSSAPSPRARCGPRRC